MTSTARCIAIAELAELTVETFFGIVCNGVKSRHAFLQIQ